MSPQLIVNLVLTIFIGLAATAIFAAIAFFLWRDWVNH